VLCGMMVLACVAFPINAAVIDGDAITTTESDNNYGHNPASELVNGKGLDANGLMHNILQYGTWIAGNKNKSDTSANAYTASGPAWVQFELDEIYELGEIWVWNGNMSGVSTYRGLRNVTVQYSSNGTTWPTLGSYEFTKASGTDTYTGFSACDFNGISAKYVVITANDVNGNWGYPNVYMLSEVCFNGTSKYATHTSPKDGGLSIATNVTLSWMAGSLASAINGQQVYFGTSYSNVSNATTGNPLGVYKGTQSGCSYSPGILDPNRTYYWRIDDVNTTISTTWKGRVRSFTTAFNSSISNFDITATASNDSNGVYPASLVKDKSGLDRTLLLHSTDPNDMWRALSSGNSSADPCTTSGLAWIMFKFDHVCELNQMWVWNCNDGATNKNRGLRDVAVEYSPDGDTWYKLGDYTFPQASGVANDPGFSACNFNGVKARYVVITAKSTNGNWGGDSYYSLSEVRFEGSLSQTVREVQLGVPWTMQYDVDGKSPWDTNAVAYSDGTRGHMARWTTYYSVDGDYLNIKTMNSNQWCPFAEMYGAGHININSTSGYTVEWRVKLLDADTSTSNAACAMGGSPQTNTAWYATLIKHDGKIWADQYYRTNGNEVVVDNDANNPDFHTLRVTVDDSNATFYVDGAYVSSAPLYSGAAGYISFGDLTGTPDANSLTEHFYIYDGGGITPKEFREPAKNRKRRIIYDSDGSEMISKVYSPTIQEFWDSSFSGLPYTQTDTIVYCPLSTGFGQFTYDTNIGDTATSKEYFTHNQTQDFIDQGTDSLKMVADFCRENDIEIFYQLRMNDLHDAWYGPFTAMGSFYFNQLKEENLDWLLDDVNQVPVNGRWTGVNYAVPNIREYAFLFCEEVCQNYDIDGIVLNFIREPVFFKSYADGNDANSAEIQMMTDLITDIRKMADKEGLKRGKPILIAAYTPDSTVYAKKIGLDIETWMAEDLIDIWVPSGYFRMNDPQVDINLAHQYGVKVYPSLENDCQVTLFDTEAKAVRDNVDKTNYALAQNWFHCGADGIYVFNYFIYYGIPQNTYPRLKYLGDPNTLAGLDKRYTTSMCGYNDIEKTAWCKTGGKALYNYDFVTPDRQLDVNSTVNKTMDILIGEDVAATDPNVLLRLRLNAALGDINDLALEFNGNMLAGYRRLDLNSTRGYTAEWRLKLMEADASSGSYAGMICSPETDNYWYVFAQQRNDKNWVKLNDGDDIEIDSDATDPNYHTLRITACDGYANLYIDNNTTAASTHVFHSGASCSLTWGDLTGAADANYFVDYVYVCDDSAYPPAEPLWTMQYDVNSKLPTNANAVTYSDNTSGNLTGYFNHASADANYCHIDTLGSNDWCWAGEDSSSSSIDVNSTIGYTVEWRVKLTDADTSTANLACSIGGSPEINKAWFATLIKHDGKIWADQYYRTNGNEVVVDNDANNPDFHTLRVTVEGGNATFYVDGAYVSSAPLHSWSYVMKVYFGDPTSTADASSFTDYFYIYDGGAVSSVKPVWTVRYEASVVPTSFSANTFKDGTTGAMTRVWSLQQPGEATKDSIDTVYLPGILHIDTTGSDDMFCYKFVDYWYHYPVAANDVNDGWNTIEMDLATGKSTIEVNDILVEVDY